MENNESGTAAASTEIRDPEGLLKAYEQAKADLVSLRTENKELKSQIETATSQEVDSEWKTKALLAETKLALNAQGIKDVDRLIKYVGTEGLDFNEEGAVVGLDDRLKTLRTDLPEIFDAKRRVGSADIFADNAANVTVDPIREQVRRALGN